MSEVYGLMLAWEVSAVVVVFVFMLIIVVKSDGRFENSHDDLDLDDIDDAIAAMRHLCRHEISD